MSWRAALGNYYAQQQPAYNGWNQDGSLYAPSNQGLDPNSPLSYITDRIGQGDVLAGVNQNGVGSMPNYGLGYGGGTGGYDWFGSMPSFGGGGGFGTSSVSAGHVTAGHADSFHGEASLVDTTDPIYSLFAPKPWMSGMLSRGREMGQAQTQDNIRLMQDNATRQGVSTSSPAYMYMVAMQRRQQAQALANSLRDANLAWTLPAADRRAGALGQNASMLTSMSDSNAGRDTNVSIANAGYSTQASAANASNQLAASSANASNSLQAQIASAGQQFQYAQLGQQGWQFRTNLAYQMYQDMIHNAFSVAQLPGSGGTASRGVDGADIGNRVIAGAGSGVDTYRSLMDFIKRGSQGQANAGAGQMTDPDAYRWDF